ncbi:MAG: molybdopterin-dependent oxidoreductase [Caldilinea sp.]
MSAAHQHAGEEPAWVHGHPHEPNPAPPRGDGAITFVLPDGSEERLPVDFLRSLPYTTVADCYIVSTGHGTSGPFIFGGVTLRELLAALLPAGLEWRYVDVISGDGFGVRLQPEEVQAAPAGRPVLLACTLDGATLTRRAGLVRLIVPSEIDDALKQVKWIERIVVVA